MRWRLRAVENGLVKNKLLAMAMEGEVGSRSGLRDRDERVVHSPQLQSCSVVYLAYPWFPEPIQNASIRQSREAKLTTVESAVERRQQQKRADFGEVATVTHNARVVPTAEEREAADARELEKRSRRLRRKPAPVGGKEENGTCEKQETVLQKSENGE